MGNNNSKKEEERKVEQVIEPGEEGTQSQIKPKKETFDFRERKRTQSTEEAIAYWFDDMGFYYIKNSRYVLPLKYYRSGYSGSYDYIGSDTRSTDSIHFSIRIDTKGTIQETKKLQITTKKEEPVILQAFNQIKELIKTIKETRAKRNQWERFEVFINDTLFNDGELVSLVANLQTFVDKIENQMSSSPNAPLLD